MNPSHKDKTRTFLCLDTVIEEVVASIRMRIQKQKAAASNQMITAFWRHEARRSIRFVGILRRMQRQRS